MGSDTSTARDTLSQRENNNRKYSHLIYPNEESSLSTVPFHSDVSDITRYFSSIFPFHLAVHQVSEAKCANRDYTELHTHDCDEINILIGAPGQLTYVIQLADETYEVDSCSSIWIPAGTPHSANVLKGNGSYVAIRLDSEALSKSSNSNVASRKKRNYILHR